MIDDELKKILDDIKFVDKISDTIRFVDPIRKKVINYNNGNTDVVDNNCFDFWSKNKVCDNCISMRSYNHNETFIKIEDNLEKTFMVTAIPFELSDRRIVIEMLKDISNTMFIGARGGANSVSTEIHSMIDNMNNLALKDPLTQIYNRRYIEEKLPIDLVNSVLLSQPLSIIMADIDFFKKVNDTYGHLTGDCVLKSFTETISECIKRGSDWIARYGGEEFVVCLPGANLEKAKEIAEQMRKSIEEKSINCGENKIKITTSFGVCSVNLKTTQSESIEELIQRVDEKLYLAKKNGRNRIEF